MREELERRISAWEICCIFAYFYNLVHCNMAWINLQLLIKIRLQRLGSSEKFEFCKEYSYFRHVSLYL